MKNLTRIGQKSKDAFSQLMRLATVETCRMCRLKISTFHNAWHPARWEMGWSRGMSVALLSIFLLSGCYDEDAAPQLGLEYFPINLGHWVEYTVDSVWMDEPAGALGSGQRNYLLREVNESTYKDNEGRDIIRVERYWRNSSQQEWTIKDIWGKVRTQVEAEQNEDNVVLRKLIFPVGNNKVWNGTLRTTDLNLQEWTGFLNIPSDWEFTLSKVHEPYQINGMTFDSTVTVTQLDREVPLGVSVVSREVYAKNVGLIHRFMTVYNIQPNAQNPASPDKDSIGYHFEVRITDFAQ